MPDGIDIAGISDQVLAPIRAQVEANVMQQLGVQQLDAAAQEVVTAKVNDAVRVQVTKNLDQIAGQAVRGSELGVAGASRVSIGESLSLGLQHVQLVSQDAKYREMLAESARMTKAKFDALVTAGFTEDQAFRLVEAEALSKGGRAR